MNKLLAFLLLMSIQAFAFDPKANFKAIVVRSPGSEFLLNPFIQKCFQSKDLPRVSVPKVQIASDDELGKDLYTINFNGTNLEPRLVQSEEKKIELEKTTDKTGYILSLFKPQTETQFTLQFEFKSKLNEVVRYTLDVSKTEAHFNEHLTETQAKQVCVKSHAWLGIGASAFSFDQKVEGLDAKSKFVSVTPGSLHLDVRYYLNSRWGILGSYKSAPGKIKTKDLAAIDSTTFTWTIYELAMQWRDNEWMKNWNGLLIYPYLRASYQIHEMPRIFISDIGESSLGTFGLHQATAGAGLNVFDRRSMYYEVYLNLKRPINSVNQTTTPTLHFDGAIGVGKSFGGKWNLGLFWHGHYDQYEYSFSKNSYENKGKTTLIFSNLDFKLGWSF